MTAADEAGARLPVALIGAGTIGRMHAQCMATHAQVVLAGIADPTPAARDFAQVMGVPWFAEADELLAKVQPGAAIVATPNALHADAALACIGRGVPVLVEKPIADSVPAALRITAAAEAAGVSVLVGHQRRHGVAVQRARALIGEGAIGRAVAATLLATWLKPTAYFDLAWRRQSGGGPVLINLIHDIDLLRFLLGEVVAVQAMAGNAQRGFDVEDTAAALLQLASGALATALVSDAAVAPWNYDLAAGEAAHYPQQPVDALMIAGTEGSITLPQVHLWRYAGPRERWGWHEELRHEHQPLHRRDPYVEQLRHLRAVAEGRELPLCSGTDATGTLRAALAVLQAAKSGERVEVADLEGRMKD